VTGLYRADHVGSLLRPPSLLEAHARQAAGALDEDEVRSIEDAAILEALGMQRDIGIDVLSDGEYRRAAWSTGFPSAVDGYVPSEMPVALDWKLGEGEDRTTAEGLAIGRVVGGRLSAVKRICGDEAAFLARHAGGPFKITTPAPSYSLARGWKPGVTDEIYASRGELANDIAAIVGAELQTLAVEGVTYLQLDNPHYPDYLTEEKKATWRSIGVDPDAALTEDLAADNAALAGIDRSSVTVACHVCRGNARSAWHTEGGYDAIAEQVFSSLEVDRWLLEYDTDRSGGFEPLRFIPPGRVVVLGLITTKVGTLERADDIARRIEEAAEYVPLEQLALSPQCGFASVDAGNLLSWDDQRRKLELVVEVARRVWA
jgi:5-methyltetrahydropteroyltriglutamate--homocysteine methyltransferase